MSAEPRQRVMAQLAEQLLAIRKPHPLRVAVDGIDAAGKTRLADELAEILRIKSRPVIRASIDGFHKSRLERYRRGENSAEGYYQDSFDYPALITNLLAPLGPGGSRIYRSVIFDYKTDQPVEAEPAKADRKAIMLLDGIFLQRNELNVFWDYCIFVQVRFETALARAIQRDSALLGGPETVQKRYQERYLPAQERYLQTVKPQNRCGAVIFNENPLQPGIVFHSPTFQRPSKLVEI